ncbi:MAG TPA: hypothetical protein DCD96_05845 [Flavobacteriales bacterium]|nr:hypothetical protein [Flavobacteriales bacterium]HRE74583.1 PIG-L family deacetylase [Flavobacteriales bacterium]HRJ35265.1 PIG-L family deacetylase [Flavobacteriales bacterium]HRJ39919.1 PIG-L family deacetylase [Flavobacteriales bacterium]
MKSGITLLVCLLHPLLVLSKEKVKLSDLEKFAPTEIYPEDVFLDTTTNKRAMVIVAHDDDDCAMSGTLFRLKQKGWIIMQICLQQHPSKNGKLPARFLYHHYRKILSNTNYRPGKDTTTLSYMPIPYEMIDRQYLTQVIGDTLISIINNFKPSVLFSLDDVKGGYGHPDHIFMSRLVKSLLQSGKIPPVKIYQSVFTPHMEKEIVNTWLKARLDKWGFPHPGLEADKLYEITGMPEPTVQVDMEANGSEKMRYLNAYPKDVRRTLSKFIPYFTEFKAKEYFRLFNREFFRIVDPVKVHR